MFTRNIPHTNASPLVEEVTQYGVKFPDGTILFEEIEQKMAYFQPNWQNTPMTYYIHPDSDNGTNRNFNDLRTHYAEYMKRLGIDAEITRVKRTITLVVSTATEAP